MGKNYMGSKKRKNYRKIKGFGLIYGLVENSRNELDGKETV